MRSIDDAGISYLVLEHGYPCLKLALGILGGIILCVLAEVTLVACFGNGLRRLGTFYTLQILNFCEDCFETLF